MRIVSKTFRSTAFRWVGVVGLMLASGCSGSGTASPTTAAEVNAGPTTEAQEVATTTTEVVEREQVTLPDAFSSPQDEIIATYLLYNELFLVAAGPPFADPDYAPLYEVLTEPHTTSIREALQDLERKGRVEVEPDDRGSHTISFARSNPPLAGEKADGQTVTLEDCFVNVTEVRDTNGNVIDDGVVTIEMGVVMKVEGGVWKVSGTDIKQVYEGTSTCGG